MATSISPSSSAATVSGPPPSSGTKLADRSRSYTESQARDAELVLGAVGRPTEGQVGGEVADVLEPQLLGRLGRDDERVRVDGGRRGERDETLRFELGLQQGDGLGRRRGRLPGAAVQELQRRRRVLGGEVDVARLERAEDDVAEPAERLLRDRISGRFQGLSVDLAEDRALAEVLRTDRDVRAIGHVAACGRVGGRGAAGGSRLGGRGSSQPSCRRARRCRPWCPTSCRRRCRRRRAGAPAPARRVWRSGGGRFS